MLSFEKVLDVFQPFLAEGVYEIVSTSHGYTILEWDACCQEWISVKLCATPDDMAETLIEHLTNHLEYKATLGRRELTEDDLPLFGALVHSVVSKHTSTCFWGGRLAPPHFSGLYNTLCQCLHDGQFSLIHAIQHPVNVVPALILSVVLIGIEKLIYGNV